MEAPLPSVYADRPSSREVTKAWVYSHAPVLLGVPLGVISITSLLMQDWAGAFSFALLVATGPYVWRRNRARSAASTTAMSHWPADRIAVTITSAGTTAQRVALLRRQDPDLTLADAASLVRAWGQL